MCEFRLATVKKWRFYKRQNYYFKYLKYLLFCIQIYFINALFLFLPYLYCNFFQITYYPYFQAFSCVVYVTSFLFQDYIKHVSVAFRRFVLLQIGSFNYCYQENNIKNKQYFIYTRRRFEIIRLRIKIFLIFYSWRLSQPFRHFGSI